MGAGYSWGHSEWASGDSFLQEENELLEVLDSPGLTLQHPSGQTAGQHFYQGRLDQVSIEVLPACNSQVLLMQEENVTSSHRAAPALTSVPLLPQSGF